MFHGGTESGAGDLDAGVGVTVVLLAMPGLLASLLMFEKYGSLIRFLRGDGVFDPFTATLPDEYFFIVLSMFVTGGAALWRWDSFFLDRRDYVNLVPLPIPLRSIFLVNLCAMFSLAVVFMLVANAASLILFPVAVAGSQNSFLVLLRYTAGHAAAVFAASTFSFWFVLAIAGTMSALLPSRALRKLSLIVRFGIAIGLLLLVASSLVVPQLLSEGFLNSHRTVALLPPLSFVSIARTIWGGGTEPLVRETCKAALSALAIAISTSLAAYGLAFRRAFVRIPESPDAVFMPQQRFSLLLTETTRLLATQAHRASAQFVIRTLLRSEIHFQIVASFAAIGVVGSAVVLSSASGIKSVVAGPTPSIKFLILPLILGYCAVVGVRLAFEIPADLRANWIFRLWLANGWSGSRQIARYVLLSLSVFWLAPVVFVSTLAFWGWTTALLHTAILSAWLGVLIELSLCNFRKIPFTCSYPPFKSGSGIVVVVYLFGFIAFTTYIAEMERWCLEAPWRAVLFVPLFSAVIVALHAYRKYLLDMDKAVIFEEQPETLF